MTFFSLSDGESALIQHPNGKNVLINSGGRNTEQELRKLLELYHVKQMDSVILTSNKSCCVNNLEWIIDQFSVQNVMSGESAAEQLQALDSATGSVNFQALNAGEQVEVLPGVLVAAVNDDDGIDLDITFLKRRVLWLNQPQNDPKLYLPNHQDSGTTIVKLPGRLTKEFVSEEVMKVLDPQIAFFYPENRQEINTELLEQLHHSWVRVYHNHDKGAVTVKFTEKNYEILKITNEKK